MVRKIFFYSFTSFSSISITDFVQVRGESHIDSRTERTIMTQIT